MMNSRLIGLFVMVTSVLFVVTGFQNIMATIEDAADVDVTEAAEAGPQDQIVLHQMHLTML